MFASTISFVVVAANPFAVMAAARGLQTQQGRYSERQGATQLQTEKQIMWILLTFELHAQGIH